MKKIAVFLLVSILIFGSLALAEVAVFGERTEKRKHSVVEKTWKPIPDKYKTKLKVYNQVGKFAYEVQVVLINETTLEEKLSGVRSTVNFLTNKENAAFLLLVDIPKGAVGGEFDSENLKIVVEDTKDTVEQAFEGNVILDSPKFEKFEYATVDLKEITPLTAIWNMRSKVQKALREGNSAYLYYKGGGPRVEVKLPGEI